MCGFSCGCNSRSHALIAGVLCSMSCVVVLDNSNVTLLVLSVHSGCE